MAQRIVARINLAVDSRRGEERLLPWTQWTRTCQRTRVRASACEPNECVQERVRGLRDDYGERLGQRSKFNRLASR